MSPAVMSCHSGGLRTRRGFTLVEVMIVMIVIAILAGLLIVAAGNAKQTTNIARVRTDIGSIEGAIANFKNAFGDYPPSRIKLYVDWNASLSGAELQKRNRSRAIIRSFWPQFDFSNTSYPWTSDVELYGSECLVFFLGGVTRSGTSELIGFSKNPARPFDRSGTSRVGPFLEFDPGRVMPSTLVSNALVYVDPLPAQNVPYLYLSANNGSGYEREDLTGRMGNWYRVGTSTNGAAWKPNTFQIISPGFDHDFGTGGPFDPETADSVLVDRDIDSDSQFTTIFDTSTSLYLEPASADRKGNAERDNITNFHGSTLAHD